jgi:hypothetical protein
LHGFQLGALLLDEKGKILDDHGVVTNRDGFDPIPFHIHLPAPAGVAAIAFSYQGTVISEGNNGGSDIDHIWEYPVHG